VKAENRLLLAPAGEQLLENARAWSVVACCTWWSKKKSLTTLDVQGGAPMLVLTRKIGERIYIGNDVVITIVKVEGQRTRIGIDAPSSIPIWRQELETVRQSWLETTTPARVEPAGDTEGPYQEVGAAARKASRRARS
jgi:carbon storage regulator